MRIWMTTIACLLFASACVVDKAPQITCDEPLFDFGEVDTRAKAIEHKFEVRNAGTAPLEIEKVTTSCGCTVAAISNKTLAPGATTGVKATFSPTGRSGKQHKVIRVLSNDSETPIYQLIVKGTVTERMEVTPKRIVFNRLSADSVETKTATITATVEEAHFKVKEVVSTLPAIQVAIETVKPAEVYTLRITTKPPLKSGRTNGYVRILTDNADFSLIQVGVTLVVVGDITVAPERIVLRRTGDDMAPQKRNIHLRPGKAKAFKVLSVVAPLPEIEVKTIPAQGRGYVIILSNIPADMRLNGKVLRITTDVESMKEITIPFLVSSVRRRAVQQNPVQIPGRNGKT